MPHKKKAYFCIGDARPKDQAGINGQNREGTQEVRAKGKPLRCGGRGSETTQGL